MCHKVSLLLILTELRLWSQSGKTRTLVCFFYKNTINFSEPQDSYQNRGFET